MPENNDNVDPACPYGHLIEQRIETLESENEEMKKQVKKIYEALVENGFFEDVRNLQDSMSAIKDKRDKEERRSWLWNRDWKIAILGAIAGGIFNTIMGSVVLAALGII